MLSGSAVVRRIRAARRSSCAVHAAAKTHPWLAELNSDHRSSTLFAS
jgi:hypothetical protein